MLSAFIQNLEQLDDNQFKIALGLTKPQFEMLFAEFEKLKDSTRKLNNRQKIYAILVIVNWSLDGFFVGSLILGSKTNSKRDGELFIQRVMPRLHESLKVASIVLDVIPEYRKKQISSLDEILQCIHATRFCVVSWPSFWENNFSARVLRGIQGLTPFYGVNRSIFNYDRDEEVDEAQIEAMPGYDVRDSFKNKFTKSG